MSKQNQSDLKSSKRKEHKGVGHSAFSDENASILQSNEMFETRAPEKDNSRKKLLMSTIARKTAVSSSLSQPSVSTKTFDRAKIMQNLTMEELSDYAENENYSTSDVTEVTPLFTPRHNVTSSILSSQAHSKHVNSNRTTNELKEKKLNTVDSISRKPADSSSKHKSISRLAKFMHPKSWFFSPIEQNESFKKISSSYKNISKKPLNEETLSRITLNKLDSSSALTSSMTSLPSRGAPRKFLWRDKEKSESGLPEESTTSFQSVMTSDKIYQLRKFVANKDEEDANFFIDDNHQNYCLKAKHQAIADLPEAIMVAVKKEVLPILIDTLKHYKLELGQNHKLTIELNTRLRQIYKEITNITVKDGNET